MEEYKEPKFYNVEQLSGILGISRSKTYELVSSPDCPFVPLKIGKRVCIPAKRFVDSMKDWCRTQTQKKKKQENNSVISG